MLMILCGISTRRSVLKNMQITKLFYSISVPRPVKIRVIVKSFMGH